MKATQQKPRQLYEYGMSAELEAPWGVFDVDIGYMVHKGDRDHPEMYEIVGVWLGNVDISHWLVDDYIFDLIEDDYMERRQ